MLKLRKLQQMTTMMTMLTGRKADEKLSDQYNVMVYSDLQWPVLINNTASNYVPQNQN